MLYFQNKTTYVALTKKNNIEYNRTMKPEKFVSIPKAAKILGFDRTHLFRLIKAKKIPAAKIGRNYIINIENLGLLTENLSKKDSKLVNKTVAKIFQEYGDVIRKLGAE